MFSPAVVVVERHQNAPISARRVAGVSAVALQGGQIMWKYRRARRVVFSCAAFGATALLSGCLATTDG